MAIRSCFGGGLFAILAVPGNNFANPKSSSTMPCQHLAQIQQLNLPVSKSDILKVICPVCGNVDVCAYTPMEIDESQTEEENTPPQDLSPSIPATGSTSAS